MSAANDSSIPAAAPPAACARCCSRASRTRSRAERRRGLATAGLLIAIAVAGAQPAWPQLIEPRADAAVSDAIASNRFRHLAAELRCLVCQNQTLVDSSAPLAQDLRNEVARLMVAGRSDAEIKSFLTARYGEFVLYRPSLSARNAVLWVGPFALLIAGALAWWRLGRRRDPPAAAEGDLARVDELLGR